MPKKESMRELFREITPLAQDKIAPYQKKIKPIPMQRQQNTARELEALLQIPDRTADSPETEHISFLRDSYPISLLKQLRRGQLRIQTELDLHGLNIQEAKQATHNYIYECAASQISTIRIIHGKGKHSKKHTPIIKHFLPHWLKQNTHVISACAALPEDGGTGATYILLK